MDSMTSVPPLDPRVDTRGPTVVQEPASQLTLGFVVA